MLRKLKMKDAESMLEWMHDYNVIENLNTDFLSKSIEDCYNFIEKSQNSGVDLNLAIVNENDQYVGTVSLKHINCEIGIAEFAIVVSSYAMGTGISANAMQEILKIGKNGMNLKNIYWCVSENNARAMCFYDKNRYCRTEKVPKELLNYYEEEDLQRFIWYKY